MTVVVSPGDAAPAVQLVDVHKCYRVGSTHVQAVRGLDLCVREGEFAALWGPSGSGKSTALNLCGLVDAPDSGEVILRGQLATGLGQRAATELRRDHIGFVFQSFNLVPVMTVAENVEFPLFLMGVEAADRRRRVAEQLEAVGLDGHAKHLPDALSGGQRQRVAIARALIKRPRLVIADEPTANLDSATADQVVDLMRDLCHSRGTAFLIATHDQRLQKRCDRVLSMVDGRLP